MLLYTVMTQDGAEQRDVIAAELVRIHTAAMTFILGVIRAGHTSEEKTQLVQALWKMFQDKTGISDSDLSVALQEVPPSQAMENGGTMPDVWHEKKPS